ncbi:hypothetical protein C1H46_037285 [Malus baccata]|uniref:Beta-glucosidase n=1 Tax=Malus baccata TaxID=106549 RepID=A0A540KSI5_MALBA|nr:hypothetical protein C1H46_037285 [Malus baccata]
MPLGFLLLALVLLIALTNSNDAVTVPPNYDTVFLNRSSFPAGFIFGTASSSYQYEGAAKGGGKGPSIWDTYTHKYPDRIKDHSNGDVTVDEYHNYKEDVRIMMNMGLDAYRFSISWPRLLPNGKLSGGVNKEGIKYYNNLINELINNGLKPFVTLFHWDLPQALHDEYGGFLSPKIVNHFRNYVELCYKEFGDRVKHWITINEPWSYSYGGYTRGFLAPGRFADPLTSGDYPQSMQRLVGNRLPKFTKEQSMMLIGSFDFLGLNYYTTYYAAYAPQPNSSDASYLIDIHAKPLYERNGVPIGPKAASDWLYVYPRGIQDLLHYIKENYHDPLIYITENGIDEFNDPKLSLEEALNDTIRVDYHYWHLYYLQKAIQDGVNVRGYFLWSLLDNFEWNSGYTVRFGINYVDYDNGLKRSPKLSAQWFKNFLSNF